MRTLAALILLVSLAFASNLQAQYKPEVNSVNVSGTVTAIIVTTEQAAFTVTVDDIDIAIPCDGSNPVAGCDQVEIGDFVRVKGYIDGWHMNCNDSATETDIVISEIWVCVGSPSPTICTLQ